MSAAPTKARKKRSTSTAARASSKRLKVDPVAAPAVGRAPIVGNQKGIGLLSVDTALWVVSFLTDSPKACANWFATNRVRTIHPALCCASAVWPLLRLSGVYTPSLAMRARAQNWCLCVCVVRCGMSLESARVSGKGLQSERFRYHWTLQPFR